MQSDRVDECTVVRRGMIPLDERVGERMHYAEEGVPKRGRRGVPRILSVGATSSSSAAVASGSAEEAGGPPSSSTLIVRARTCRGRHGTRRMN